MSNSTPSFLIQGLSFVAGLSLILGIAWWFTRDARKEFRILRVFVILICTAMFQALLLATWWWLAPKETDRQNLLLLAAAFIPLCALIAWGFVIGIRSIRQKKHEHPTA
jgi:hypothetical protein